MGLRNYSRYRHMDIDAVNIVVVVLVKVVVVVVVVFSLVTFSLSKLEDKSNKNNIKINSYQYPESSYD